VVAMGAQVSVHGSGLADDETATGEPCGDLLVRGSALGATEAAGDLIVRTIDEFPVFCGSGISG